MKCILTLILLLCIQLNVFATDSIDPSLRKNELTQQLKELKNNHLYLIGKITALKGGRLPALSPKERKIVKEYKELNKLLTFWTASAGLKEALVNRYIQATQKQVDEDLNFEAANLSFELIQEIDRLQKQYKINSFPMVHNFLIMLHYKKRGACKDWAEDLLKKIEKIPRKYFTAYWGEAFPGKVTEHNVAVLVPHGTSFNEGLMIDPWRTAGKPFWLHVTKDHFYKWQAWPAYEPR